MRKLSLENPEIIDILNHQVIHMDQGITYTPEYLATRKMSNYPSRTAQIIRSVSCKRERSSDLLPLVSYKNKIMMSRITPQLTLFPQL